MSTEGTWQSAFIGTESMSFPTPSISMVITVSYFLTDFGVNSIYINFYDFSGMVPDWGLILN